MFSKDTYMSRRKALRELVGEGLILIPGNNNSPVNYPSNTYKFRQDSTFLYFFGAQRDGLWGLIDSEKDKDFIVGNEIDIDDIVWYGSVDSVGNMGERVGADHMDVATMKATVAKALSSGKKIHFLPPYRHDIQIELAEMLNMKPSALADAASMPLTKAVVKLRSTKSAEEIEEIERACAIGYKMHTTAMKMCRPGVTEQEISGAIGGIADSYGCMVSFQSIVTMHGEIMHGYPSLNPLEDGRLMLCDAGAETVNNYCSDNTRTTPINGKFTQRQKDIYSIVEDCHDLALKVARPGVKWWDVHMDVCRLMTERLQTLGLMKGDVEESVKSGAHALFLPHGLGHMMGMDVHDMEGLGQTNVGYDDEVRPSSQFGTASLRFGRRLEEGFVVTDEPGIYFIPQLIDLWRKEGTNAEFLNFDAIESFKDFGGIRIEDDVLITADGCRFLGKDIIPYHIADVEEYIKANRN